jgi:hypothetical protein
MVPLIELAAVSGIPFIFGIMIGYGLRSYISQRRRLRSQRG